MQELLAQVVCPNLCVGTEASVEAGQSQTASEIQTNGIRSLLWRQHAMREVRLW